MMRTRKTDYSGSSKDGIAFSARSCSQNNTYHINTGLLSRPSKFRRNSRRGEIEFCGFDRLPDDLLLSIIMAVSSSADKPCDLVNTMLTCKRFYVAAKYPQVLAIASAAALEVRACNWSEGAHRFLKMCVDAENKEACYILGMIRFYCLQNRCGGSCLMAKAAVASHPAALHSLAVIQFNGSGGTRKDKDLKAGVALCARAAGLGHVDAMREIGHCLQDGYGVRKNIVEGRRLLLEANAQEAAEAVASTTPGRFLETALRMSAISCTAIGCLRHHLYYHQAFCKTNHSSVEQPEFSAPALERHHLYRLIGGGGCSLLSDFGCNVPPPKLHVAHRFLIDWFRIHPPPAGLRSCSHGNCGRPETRRHEFRRCSACGTVNYCSRACQALDWRIRHKHDCTPTANWEDLEGNMAESAERVLNEIENF